MKKKLILSLILLISNTVVEAQELTKQMFTIYFGQPKTLVQSNNLTSETMTIEFDKSGRVLSKSGGGGKMVYNWSSDGKSVEVKMYNNGQYIGASMAYVQETTAECYKYDSGGATCELTFRNNGSLNKIVLSGGGQSISTTYYYNSSTEVYPYKIVTAGGGQSMTMTISGISKDSYGNCVKFTQSAQGQSMTITNNITYY